MHGDGAVYEVVTTDYANTVADNVYRYASREDYYGCAREAFEEIHALLKCLIRFFTRLRRPKEAVLLEHMYRKFNYFGLNGAYTTRPRSTISSPEGTAVGEAATDFDEDKFMRKKFLLWVFLSAIVMLLFPGLAVTFVKGDVGMAACLVLFFGINPIHFLVLGAVSGMDLRRMWSQPILSAALYLLGVWIFFSAHETAFLVYAGVYLALSGAAMLISCLVSRKVRS